MQENKQLDLDVEQFNPKITRGQYQRRGFTPAVIETLVELDAMIYNSPPDEVRAAVAARRNRMAIGD